MFILSVKLPRTSGMRLRHPPHVAKTICSFCGERWKRNDETSLLPVPQELTYCYFSFPIYCCDECVADGELTYLTEMMEIIRLLENFHVLIHFNDHPIVNPSDVYVPFLGSSGNLQFLCMNKKCSMNVRRSPREQSFFHESSIHGCVIDPQSGEIKMSSVSIAQIILGIDLLNKILRQERTCTYINSIGEFHSEQIKNSLSFLSLELENQRFLTEHPDLRIIDAIQQSAPESYVGPRIDNFSIGNPESILKLFSLIVSGIYSDSAIKVLFTGEMKEEFLKFITDSMISMTDFLKENGFNDCFPELKEHPSVSDFLIRNYGRAGFSFTQQDIICQNFRNFLKLFRKILRYYYFLDDSHRAIDLFQYCRFLYATLHVSNQEIYHRLTRQIPYQKLSPYSEYLDRYAISVSPFSVEIFAMIPASEKELDRCAICQSDNSANIIGRCSQHNICCSECFPRIVQNLKACPICREEFFLP